MSKSRLSTRLGFSPGRFVWGVRVAAVVLGGVATGLMPVACEKKPAAAPQTPQTTAAAPAQSYTVRGVIEQLPDATYPANTLRIHHEAIPGFMTDGKVVGMVEMSMPFPTAPGVSLDGLGIGDAVEFVFEVQEKPRLTYHITTIKKLPPGPTLNLIIPRDSAAPPASTPAGG